MFSFLNEACRESTVGEVAGLAERACLLPLRLLVAFFVSIFCFTSTTSGDGDHSLPYQSTLQIWQVKNK